jgi:hypothetical protein
MKGPTMPERHPLATEGSWVELRDPHELKAGDQMDVQDAMEADTSGKLMRQMTNAVISVLVVNWHLPSNPLPIPSQAPDALRMLDIRDYNALKKLVDPAQELIFPSDPEPEDAKALAAAQADPASPTAPTAES